MYRDDIKPNRDEFDIYALYCSLFPGKCKELIAKETTYGCGMK